MITSIIRWTDKITGLSVEHNNWDSPSVPMEIIENIEEFDIDFSETVYGETNSTYALEVYNYHGSYKLILWDCHPWTENNDALINIIVAADDIYSLLEKVQLAINRIYTMVWDNFNPYLMEVELIHTLER